jgi:hypothetical protein
MPIMDLPSCAGDKTPTRSLYLTTVASMARKNKIENNVPSTLSAVNATFTWNQDHLGISGSSGGRCSCNHLHKVIMSAI